MVKNKKFIITGIIAGLLLLSVFFIILSTANSFSHAIEQFSRMWYWILLLITGFGLQAGLYSYIRASLKLKQMADPAAAVAASAGITTGSMVACCLHHLVDVLPLMGLAAASLFLVKYQLLFIIIGVLSNLIGIAMMLEIIQKHDLSNGFLKKLTIYNMNKIKKITIVLSLVLAAAVFIVIFSPEQKFSEERETSGIINLSSRSSSQNNISFKATPIGFSFDNPVRFEIGIDTHSGSLDFDLTEVSVLEDNNNNRYQPLDWQGSASGGHHRSGIITFPKLSDETEKIKLIIQDDFNNPPRIFEWELK